MNDMKSIGLLRINNEADRVTVASILYKNGYSVAPVRCKRNGKTFEYFVKYELKGPSDKGEEICRQEAGYGEGEI